jgi:serine/threonine protein kinase/Tol biopolymer transport system component
MPLTTGTRLGPYEIVSRLGAGGMGEVYRARDTRLDRTVALKVLTPLLADDALFRDRFQREARTISSLNHPYICTLHDVGSQDGIEFLVMEYLEGETLADRLARGPLTVEEALRLATQIAVALERAHREGIVHRDLKPGNIMLVRAGAGGEMAKLLDFGLAKQSSSASAGLTVTSPATASPGHADRAVTRTSAMTAEGTIVGTFKYMAPEQLEGKDVDARSDIWAFGCVLYEMVTARPPFEAPTQAGLIAAILERQPPPLDLASPLAPALQRVVAACLEKIPDDRFQTVRDVRRELEWLPHRADFTSVPAGRNRRSSLLAWSASGAALLVAGTAFVTWRVRPEPASSPATIFNLTLPPNEAAVGSTTGIRMTPRPAVSPDGSRIAFVAHDADGDYVSLRPLAEPYPRPVKGTAGARGVFWSPDGGSIGFFAAGKLKTLELATGRLDIICDAPAAFGGTWGKDDTILFSPDERSPIFKVAARGGMPLQVTNLDPARHDQAHRWPQFLPDGRHFIYMPWTDGTTNRSIQLAGLDGSPPRTLFDAQSAAIVAGDYLLYASDMPSRLMARRFDVERLEADDVAFAAVADDNVDYSWMTGETGAAAGGNVIVYTTGKYRMSRLTWVDRIGRSLGTFGETGAHFDPRLSPDGTMVALERHDWTKGSGDVWTVDPARGAFSRLTSAPGYETAPVWSPDGRRIAFASDQGNVPKIYVRNANGTGADEILLEPPARSFPTDWSHNGRYLLFMLNGGVTRTDIWRYDLGERTAAPFLASSFDEGWATLSPDGKWMAYVSDENAQPQVYVRSFPDGEFKAQISTGGGAQPQWRRDGKELFYIAPDNTLMSVDVQVSGGRLRATAPHALFTANVEQGRTIRNQFAVSPDGQRFLILSAVNPGASPIVAVLNWRTLITR